MYITGVCSVAISFTYQSVSKLVPVPCLVV